jgi:hypothetical protein
MIESGSGQEMVYAIDPDSMELAISWWLTPVIADLKQVNDQHTQARGELMAVHQNQPNGWFGGYGNSNEVRWASSTFFSEALSQLEPLLREGAELAASLEEYRDMLLAHIRWARQMDEQNAERFRGIERDMTEKRGW